MKEEAEKIQVIKILIFSEVLNMEYKGWNEIPIG